MTHAPMIHPAEAPRDPDIAPPPLHPLWRPLLTLDVIFFLAAALTIYLAPCGTWTNNVAGVKMWDSSDPGGDYVISALYFYPPGRTLPFIGHPGLTLQLPIWIVARTVYGFARLTSAAPTDYFSFWSQHVRWLFILSGWLVAALHVVSFHVLEATSRRLLKNPRAAFFTVLGYATLFPVLFYSTRISTEPLLVIFTLGTFLNLWTMAEARAAGNAIKSWRSAAWAGACAILGTFTKLQLTLPLVPFSFIYLVILLRKRCGAGFQPASELQAESLHHKSRPISKTVPILAYLVAAGIIGGLANARMDWHDFLNKWAYYLPGGAKQTHRHGGDVLKGDAAPLPTAGGVVGGVVKAFISNIVDYVPYVRKPAARDGTIPGRALSQSSLFTVAEAVFLAMAFAGLWKTLKNKPDLHAPIGWMIVYALALLPFWAYRGLWHYLSIQLVIAAIFFGAFIDTAIAAKFGAGDPRRRFRIGVLAILTIHLLAIGFTLSSTIYDIHSFRVQIQPALQAVERTNPGRTIAYISKSAPVYGQWYGAHGWVDSATEFHAAFQSRFVSLADPSLLTPEWARAHRVQFVLSGGSRKYPLHLIPIADWIPPIKQIGK